MKASTTIYAGSLVCVDGNGLALPAADTSGYNFVGVADEQVTSAASGSYYIRVRTGGDIKLPAVSIAQTMIGDVMYVVDSSDFDDSAGVSNNVQIGTLTQYVSATEGWVDILSATSVPAAATAVSFADGSTLVHEATLTAVDVDAALEELHTEFDDHICEDGAGSSAVSPGTNREHFAGAVAAVGCGVAIRVRSDGSGTTAKYLLAITADYAAGGYPIVSDADPTNVTKQPELYGPSAIGASTNGWAYQVYYQLNSGINTTTSAAGKPIFCGAAGILAIAKPTTGSCWICGSVLSAAADGEIQIMLPACSNPQFTTAYTVTAGDAAANLLDIDTGWGVNPVSFSYFILSSNIVVSGKDEVVTIGTGGAGQIRIADGAATYNTVQNDVVYLIAWLY
jgi:hypothetical protein